MKLLFHQESFSRMKNHLRFSKKKLVRVLRDEGESRLLDNSLVLNGVQILNNLSKVSHCNPPKSEEIFKQLIL